MRFLQVAETEHRFGRQEKSDCLPVMEENKEEYKESLEVADEFSGIGKGRGYRIERIRCPLRYDRFDDDRRRTGKESHGCADNQQLFRRNVVAGEVGVFP